MKVVKSLSFCLDHKNDIKHDFKKCQYIAYDSDFDFSQRNKPEYRL